MTLVHAHLLPLPEWPEPPYVPDWMPAEPSVREQTLERLRLFAAPTAVLTVSAPGLGPSPARIREVLCAISLAPGCEETALFASELAHRTQSALPILHVVEGQGFQASAASLDAGSRARLAAAAERGPFAPTLVRAGQPSREILRTAAERGVDLIVMGVHDRGPASRGLFGSTADRVVREATGAVVAVRRAALGNARASTSGAVSSLEQLA